MTPTEGLRSPGVGWAIIATVGAGGAWMLLAAATGLIFLLMPAAPPLLGGAFSVARAGAPSFGPGS